MSTNRTLDRVAVVGAGTMGHGIAQTFAQEGYDVIINDVDEDILSTALENIEGSLQKLGIENPDSILEQIETTTDDETAFESADLVVEALVAGGHGCTHPPIVLFAPADTEAQVQPAAADHVHGGDLLGQQHGGVPG